MAQRQFEQSFLKRRAVTCFLMDDGLTRRFEQRSVADSRRAGGFAGPATQAALDATFETRGLGVEPAFSDGPHQEDSPARAVVFIAELLISRAGRQTQSAVNAAQYFLRFGVKRDLKRISHISENPGGASC